MCRARWGRLLSMSYGMAEELIQIAGSSRTPDEKIQAAIDLLDWLRCARANSTRATCPVSHPR